MIEIFKDITGYEGLYQVSNFGRVKSLEKTVIAGKGLCVNEERIIKGSITKKGYLAIALYKNKIKKTFPAHRLVALNFIPNPQNKPEVNHLNGIKTDNSTNNLEWATGSENVRHAFAIGTRVKQLGSLNNNAKLDDQKVIEIKLRYKEGGIAMRKIAKEYSVDYALIQRIIKGRAWPHVTLKTA